jgi:hypothetical protein
VEKLAIEFFGALNNLVGTLKLEERLAHLLHRLHIGLRHGK